MAIKKERHVGIELLRILSMVFVLNLHYLIKGQYSKSNDAIVNFESWMIICVSVVAVNCYVLISGYFMSDKNFKLNRITQTYSQVWFYSVFTFVCMALLKIYPFSFGGAFTAITPFIHNSYWFASSYLLLLLFTPLLNTAINNFDKAKFELLLLLLLGIYCVFNNVVKIINPIDKTAGYGGIWFIVLYLVAAYLRRFYVPKGKPGKFFLLYFLTVVLNLIFQRLFGRIGEVWNNGMVRDYNNILVFLGAVFIFLAFINVNISNRVLSRVILFLSPLTFAVYLIHESPFVQNYLWSIINVENWVINNPFFIIMALLTSVVLFLLFSIIEFCRKQIFILTRIDYIINKLTNKFEKKIRDIIVSRSR